MAIHEIDDGFLGRLKKSALGMLRNDKVSVAPNSDTVKLTPIEQCELRVMDAMRFAAEANLQVMVSLLKNRAHQIASGHGVDLSKEAEGSWDLRIDEGVISKASKAKP